jgi:hypothetical protein
MNLVDLIVFVCSITNPNACREQHLLFESSGTLNACMMQAQPYLAQWLGEHPDLKIVRFECAWPESEGKGI